MPQFPQARWRDRPRSLGPPKEQLDYGMTIGDRQSAENMVSRLERPAAPWVTDGWHNRFAQT
jgi:hypothetical protein